MVQAAAGASGGSSGCRGDGAEGSRGGREAAGGGALGHHRHSCAARVQRAVSHHHRYYQYSDIIHIIRIHIHIIRIIDCLIDTERTCRTERKMPNKNQWIANAQ